MRVIRKVFSWMVYSFEGVYWNRFRSNSLWLDFSIEIAKSFRLYWIGIGIVIAYGEYKRDIVTVKSLQIRPNFNCK